LAAQFAQSIALAHLAPASGFAVGVKQIAIEFAALQ
jgi:hypothetical protein